MSYLAIARKYRPATFDEIVGQDHVTRTLKNAITSGRVHHAFLFCGARGVGKTTAARALAKALNCAEGPKPEPCGVCTSCEEVAKGNSPDLIEIDGASNNSVDDIRSLRETVGYAPTTGRYKVYLIDEVHMLSKAAFNALLKTLEEPPPHVIFLFATTEPEKILETILSRVQRFDFKRIPAQVVADRLKAIAKAEGAELSDASLRTIARAGEGSMRDAQSLLDKVISFGGSGVISDAQVAETLGLIDRSLLHGMLGGLVKSDPEGCLSVIDKVYGYGYELSQFTLELLGLLRHATFLRMSDAVRKHVDLSEDEMSALHEIVKDCPTDVLTRQFREMLEVHEQVVRSQRPRIVLEMAVVRLTDIRPALPIDALMQRLEDLERRTRHGGGGSGRARPDRRGPRGKTPPRSAQRSPAPARHTAIKGDGPTASLTPTPQEIPDVVNRPPDPVAPTAPPEPEVTTPEASPEAAPSEAVPEEERSWVTLTQALTQKGGDFLILAQAICEPTDEGLTLRIPSGRKLAKARQVASQELWLSMVREHLGQHVSVELRPTQDTATESEQHRERVERFLSKPEHRRIQKELNATIEKIWLPEEEGGQSDDPPR